MNFSFDFVSKMLYSIKSGIFEAVTFEASHLVNRRLSHLPFKNKITIKCLLKNFKITC